MSTPLTTSNGPLAILYEHPRWFEGLFAELDRRRVAYERLLAHRHRFDPAERSCPYSLVVNRMSPSAYLRGHGRAIPYTLQYLAYLQDLGVDVVNGYEAYLYEFSKARQVGLLQRLGLPHPRTRVVSDPAELPAAAEGLRFPVIVKPNIGGSGANIARFGTPAQLAKAADEGGVEPGIDHVILVQEYVPPADNSIVRVEVLGGEVLYTIRLGLVEDEFNLCPADYCVSTADDFQRGARRVEACVPPDEVVRDVKRLLAAARIDVGGVEYLIDGRDGRTVYFDINALSNFVADAENVVGFDPMPRFVDYLLERSRRRSRSPLARRPGRYTTRSMADEVIRDL